jgi:sugar phosphate permease
MFHVLTMNKGIFEAGVLPGIAYYMSRWYRRSELVFRLSCYMVMAPLAGAFGGLLASAILKLESFGGLTDWRMIFAVEGIITCGLAVVAFFVLTDSPASARWLSQEEKDLAIARVKSERVGTTDVLEKMNWAKIMRGILNPITITVSWVFLLNNITVQGLAFFLPTIVKTIYPLESVVSQQLRTVPPYAVGAFFTLAWGVLSWRFDKRNIFFIITPPLTMIGYIMFLATSTAQLQARYAATFFITSGAFAFGALSNAHISANVVSDTARSASIGFNVMAGGVGGLISTWAFLPFDGPDYHIGNGLNFAAASTTFLTMILLHFWIRTDNKKRAQKDVDAELEGLDQKSIDE